MEEQQVIQTIEQASVQARATDTGDQAGGGLDVFSWLAAANSLLPAWWSRARDRQLRAFWRQNDALSSAIYTLCTKISAIPFHVEPRDLSVLQHLREAERYTENLYNLTDFGAGWEQGLSRGLEDLFSQDNGAFFEVIGEGDKAGPIVGPALGLATLDSSRCQRTRSPEYPVVYTDWGGIRYKLHHTRVLPLAQMPSTAYEMNGVGFCAASRCCQAAQNLWDIATYKMEKLGSRPKRQILIGEKGLSTTDILTAMRLADQQLDSQGLSRYSRNVVLAPKVATANTEIRLGMVDLASAPDGFDEQSSVTLGVYLMAWAFGVDAREFWPAVTSGATKADALVQHMKSRGKAIGNTLSLLGKKIDRFMLPPYLHLVFDLQDNEEDLVRSQVKLTRSQARRLDHETELVSDRVMRQEMLHDGDLSQDQFEELELGDGRLPADGESVLSLLYSPDPLLHELLTLPGGLDPLAPAMTWERVQAHARRGERKALEQLTLPASPRNANRRKAAQQALAVWEALEKRLRNPEPPATPVPVPGQRGPAGVELGEGEGEPARQAGAEEPAPATPQERMLTGTEIAPKARQVIMAGAETTVLPLEEDMQITVPPPDMRPIAEALIEVAKILSQQSKPVVNLDTAPLARTLAETLRMQLASTTTTHTLTVERDTHGLIARILEE